MYGWCVEERGVDAVCSNNVCAPTKPIPSAQECMWRTEESMENKNGWFDKAMEIDINSVILIIFLICVINLYSLDLNSFLAFIIISPFSVLPLHTSKILLKLAEKGRILFCLSHIPASSLKWWRKHISPECPPRQPLYINPTDSGIVLVSSLFHPSLSRQHTMDNLNRYFLSKQKRESWGWGQ